MLKFVATPLFLVLAAITSADPVYLCSLPGPFSFVGSMWFMYLAMAAVHAQPWLDLALQWVRSEDSLR
jgi:hypothetical protein